MSSHRKKIICIVGATASGKTGLGVELAKRFNGEIVSADSRQIYCGLNIGTGKEGQPKVGKKQETRNKKQTNSKFKIQHNNESIKQLSNCLRYIDDIPQWLIDICEPEAEFNMFDWLELAKKVVDDIWLRGKVPIVVGGTGLYVQALIEGFTINQKSKIKNQNLPASRQGDNSKLKIYSREQLDSFDLEKLQKVVEKLKAKIWQLEAIDIHNPRRLIRFIERVQAGEEPVKIKPDFDFILIGRDLPREVLYAKIDKRVEEWFCEGFYEEIKGLLDGGVSIEWLNKIGLEYKILGNYIENQKLKIKNQNYGMDDKQFAEMKQRMKYAIHQYARRQLTWWRRFDVKWVDNPNQAAELAKEFIK